MPHLPPDGNAFETLGYLHWLTKVGHLKVRHLEMWFRCNVLGQPAQERHNSRTVFPKYMPTGSVAQRAWFTNVTTTSLTILVLWGQGFDEIAASIFVAELRRMGKRVKLVGLNSQRIVGQHGLALVPDLTLGQALRHATHIGCIIVPAPLAALQRFSYDPRLAELLEAAANNHALIVSDGGYVSSHDAAYAPRGFAAPARPGLGYPSHIALIPFVHEVLSPQIE